MRYPPQKSRLQKDRQAQRQTDTYFKGMHGYIKKLYCNRNLQAGKIKYGWKDKLDLTELETFYTD